MSTRDDNREVALFLGGCYQFEVEELTPYQYRFSKDGKVFDYYPTSGKVNWVGTKGYPVVPDLEKFIQEHYAA